MKKASAKTVFLNAVKTILLPVLVYFLLMLLSGGRFGSARSLNSVFRAACQNSIMSLGTMFILAAGMWDFSAGAQIFVVAGLVGTLINNYALSPVAAIIAFIVVSVLMRAFVAAVYSVVRVKSMVCTLALAMVFESISKYFFAPSVNVKAKDVIQLAYAPNCYILLAVAVVIAAILWHKTKFAYHVRALGAGESVARSIGLNPMKERCKVWLVQGVFLGFVALIYLGSTTTVRPPTNLSSNVLVFNSLMAVFIGQALERWSNRIVGVLIGTLVMTMLSSGLVAMGINSAWQNSVTGIFMALFVGFSTNQQRVLDYFANRKRAAMANEKFAQLAAKKTA